MEQGIYVGKLSTWLYQEPSLKYASACVCSYFQEDLTENERLILTWVAPFLSLNKEKQLNKPPVFIFLYFFSCLYIQHDLSQHNHLTTILLYHEWLYLPKFWEERNSLFFEMLYIRHLSQQQEKEVVTYYKLLGILQVEFYFYLYLEKFIFIKKKIWQLKIPMLLYSFFLFLSLTWDFLVKLFLRKRHTKYSTNTYIRRKSLL